MAASFAAGSFEGERGGASGGRVGASCRGHAAVKSHVIRRIIRGE
ncbi:hypothetical protein [Roseateles sp.]